MLEDGWTGAEIDLAEVDWNDWRSAESLLVDQVPPTLPPDGSRGNKKFHWDALLDGRAHLLVRGRDFDSPPQRPQRYAHTAAMNRGLRVRTRITAIGNVVLQALPGGRSRLVRIPGRGAAKRKFDSAISSMRPVKRALLEALVAAEGAKDYVLAGTIRHYIEWIGDVIDNHDHAGRYAEIVDADGTVRRWDPARKRYRLAREA